MLINTNAYIVQMTTYYPYGEPTVEPTGQRFLFGGKEREHAAARNTYDFSARCLTPYGNWNVIDPKADDFYSFSPYSYCAGDPINYIDPDGKGPITFTIIAFIAGAAIDFTIQTITNYCKYNDIKKSVKEVDATSVVGSGILSIIGGPAISSIRGASAIGVIVVDAAVDVKLDGSVKYIGGNKEENNKKHSQKVLLIFQQAFYQML